jgi:hypothetical protein
MNAFLVGLFLISATIIFNANGHNILGYDVYLLSVFWVWVGIILWICALILSINAVLKEKIKQKENKNAGVGKQEFKDAEKLK